MPFPWSIHALSLHLHPNGDQTTNTLAQQNGCKLLTFLFNMTDYLGLVWVQPVVQAITQQVPTYAE